MAEGPQRERRKRIPRRRQGHEYNIPYRFTRTCEPNQLHVYGGDIRDGMLVRIVHLLLSLPSLSLEKYADGFAPRSRNVGLRLEFGTTIT